MSIEAYTTAPSSKSSSSSPERNRQTSVTAPATIAVKPTSVTTLRSIGSSDGRRKSTKPSTTPSTPAIAYFEMCGSGGGGGGVYRSSSSSSSPPAPNVSRPSSSDGSSGCGSVRRRFSWMPEKSAAEG